MRSSVVVSTYNNTRALDLVLCAMARQRHAPDEVMIADDGSTDETAALIESYSQRFKGRLHHVWQSDRGHRRGRVANEAVRRATGDYLIFLDGDSIPHSRWVADHMQGARDGLVLCGRRVKLGPELSEQISRDWIESGRLDSKRFLVWGRLDHTLERWDCGIRLPVFLAEKIQSRPRRLMGVNFSLSRAMFEAINGWEEDNPVGRRDDKELEMRILRAGYGRYPLIHRAIVYHLHHPVATNREESRQWLAEQEASTHTRARIGLDATAAFDPQA